jgi:hypothetical protein
MQYKECIADLVRSHAVEATLKTIDTIGNLLSLSHLRLKASSFSQNLLRHTLAAANRTVHVSRPICARLCTREMNTTNRLS